MMQLEPAVKQETARIALGTAVLACVMMLVFLILGKFDMTVLWGTLLGYAAAIANFFLMALTVQKAVTSMKDEPAPPAPIPENENGDEEETPGPALSKAARARVQASYTRRMLLLAAVGIIALTVDCFHPVATLICFLFPRLVISLLAIAEKKQKEA